METRIVPSTGVAGSLGTFTLEVQMDEPLRNGSWVRIVPFRRVANYWGPVQNASPARENYVSLTVPPGVCGELRVTDRGWNIVAAILEGELKPGGKLALVFGDTSLGGPGLRLGTLAGRAEFRVYLRPHTGSEEREVPSATTYLDILPGEPSKLLLRTRKQPGKDRVVVRMAATDEFGNTVVDRPSALILDPVGDESAGFPARGKALCEMEAEVPDRLPGGRIEVIATDLALAGRTDPVSPQQQVFWGDLHCHTRLAQGLETPEFLYDYAVNDAALDFLCHVEHYCASDEDRWIGQEWRKWHTKPAELREYIRDVWSYQQELVRAHNHPGRFVAFLGYEWASNIYGHMNVVFPDDSAELVYPQSFWSASDTPETLYARLADKEAVVIPHHPSWPVHNGRHVSGVDWHYCDERLTRLVEICSKHGVSEYFGCPDAIPRQAPEGTVSRALSMGHRLGFVGSTDSHASRPGSFGLPGDLWAPRAGITAVFGEELDRGSIYDALRLRRCYATTGARMVLDFSVNGAPMGSRVGCPREAERSIRGSVLGTAGISHLELVKDGEVIFRRKPGRADVADFEFVDRRPPEGGCYYYMRVMQVDGHQGWSSPVWVDVRRG